MIVFYIKMEIIQNYPIFLNIYKCGHRILPLFILFKYKFFITFSC